MTIRLPRTTREFVYVPGIKAFAGAEAVDPTVLPVDAAYLVKDELPAEADWVETEWDPIAVEPTVQVLTGPGGLLDPGAGDWLLWVRVRGAIEEPTRPVAHVKIT